MPVRAHPLAAAEAAVRTRLLALGYSEAISSSFASEAEGATFAAKQRGVVALENPLSEEARLLRPSLVPGMLAMLGHNLNRDVREARLFEQGAIFTGSAQVVDESHSLSLGLTGNLSATRVVNAKDAGIFELKGVIESLLSLFAVSADSLAVSAITSTTFTNDAPAWLERGRGATASLNGKPIACFGELSATEREVRKLRQPVYIAEVDLDVLYSLPLRRATAGDLSRFQAVERDFSFTFPNAVSWQAVADAVDGLGIAELATLAPVEIFRDPKSSSTPAGHYALLLRCVFQSLERTLREDELTDWSARLIATLTALGGVLRT
jgi:phenylalanyl-tRNA synthetase beta chain